MSEKKHLSGKAWWKANQRNYPNSDSLDKLAAGFRGRVEKFIQALRNAGATVVIRSTLRHTIRAYLMHYSWKVGHGTIKPSEVPKKSGVVIEWDHGDDNASRKAAMEMVKLFGMVHLAALTSNHTRGTAIDMTISWKDKLVLKLPGSKTWEITSKPRDGNNSELHKIGADYYEVFKLKSDPPHWSHNGK